MSPAALKLRTLYGCKRTLLLWSPSPCCRSLTKGLGSAAWLHAHYVSDVRLLISCCSLAEGRQPWGAPAAGPPATAAQLGGGGGGVWSAVAGESGRVIAAGGDDGVVTLWDLRSRGSVWQVWLPIS